MFPIFGLLFLAPGSILLRAAMLAVIRGRIRRDPPKLKPGRRLPRAAASAEFWLDVAWHTLIAAAAIAMAVSWLRK